jgi:uncharacterized membrane protein YhaH (DUF805 family)
MSGIRHLLTLLSPWQRATRGSYWLVVALSALASVAAWSAKNVVPAAIVLAVIVATELIVLIATARRLHDSGWSLWWLVLFLFPDSMTWDLVHVQIGWLSWHFLDVSAAIRFIPILIGLVVSSRATSNDVVGEAPDVARSGVGLG